MKRFKVHTITEGNCKWIFSKVRKFFENRDGFTSWHQFYGGMRRRVSTVHNNYKYLHYSPFENKEDNPFPFYNEPRERILHTYNYGFEVESHEDCEEIPEDTICIEMNEEEGFCLSLGDQVAFLGNRIIVRTKSLLNLSPYKYLYQVFQILKES